ncbi:E3 ubiquitin-protein ligase TRIM7-like [Elgaria multicarinata webbii]|uniref:E3 ubiquitin-protein ligase TRIM7-like n=1 Tax=Elgaria multicarinata webbii TaxID=159646 RepID=UPI002FCCE579
MAQAVAPTPTSPLSNWNDDSGGETPDWEWEYMNADQAVERRASICVVCNRSKKHHNHRVLPVEEAFQEYKEKIQSYLQLIKIQRMKVLDQKTAEKLRGQKCLAQLEQERKKSLSAFEEMQQFVEEKKRSWLACLGDLEAKFKERQKGNVARLSKEITSLSELIVEMERKCQQPAREFLQDIKSTLNRYEATEGNQLAELPSELEKTFKIYAERSSALEASVKNCKVNITLDPDTAHPCLNLHWNRMTVTKEDRWQNLPDKAERFDKKMCVLGCEKFSSGSHKWMVKVEGHGSWAVGVAREAVERKGEIGLNPNKGIWALEMLSSSPYYFSQNFSALTSPKKTVLSLQGVLKKILVSLDMEKSHVAFSDAETGTEIFTFLLEFSSGERICPFFCVNSGTLSLNEEPRSSGR